MPPMALPGAWITQKESPPIEFICGYTTAMVAAAAIIASRALPPSRNTAKADSDANECGATAIPRMPHFACIKIPLIIFYY